MDPASFGVLKSWELFNLHKTYVYHELDLVEILYTERYTQRRHFCTVEQLNVSHNTKTDQTLL